MSALRFGVYLQCFAILPFFQGVGGGANDKALTDFRQRLSARDASIRSIFLRYEAETIFAPVAPPNKAHRESGWWYWEQDLQAAAAVSENDGLAPRWEHVVWDGVKARRRIGVADWENAESILKGEFTGPAKSEISPKYSTGVLGRMHSPGQLGLFMLNRQWSTYLDVFSKLHVVDDGDRSTLTIIGDMDGHSGSDQYSFPWRIAFDKETLLATKVEFFTNALGQGNEEVRLQLNGVEWRLMGWKIVDQWDELSTGIWTGTVGRVGMEVGGGTYTAVRLIAGESFVNGSIAPVLRDVAPVDGDEVNDLTTGQRYTAGHANDPDYDLNATFLRQLGAVGSGLDERWRGESQMRAPFSRTSFGGAAVFAFLWLHDPDTSLTGLMEQAEFRDLSAKQIPVDELESIRSASGGGLQRVHLEQAVRGKVGWCLYLKGKHLQLVRFTPSGALMFKPLSGVDIVAQGDPEYPIPGTTMWTYTDDPPLRTNALLYVGFGGLCVAGIVGIMGWRIHAGRDGEANLR